MQTKVRVFFLICAFLTCLLAQAQVTLTVLDSATRQPLPFSTVSVGKDKNAFFTDPQGKVVLQAADIAGADSIKVMHVGYVVLAMPVPPKTQDTFTALLRQVTYNLPEVTVKSLNAAGLMKKLARTYVATVASTHYQARAYFVSTWKMKGKYRRYVDSYMHLFALEDDPVFYRGENIDVPTTVGLHLNTRASKDYASSAFANPADTVLVWQLLLDEPFQMQKFFLFRGPLSPRYASDFDFTFQDSKNGLFEVAFASKKSTSKETFTGKGSLFFSETDSTLVRVRLERVKLPLRMIWEPNLANLIRRKDAGYANEYQIDFGRVEGRLVPVSTVYEARYTNGLEEFAGVYLKSLPKKLDVDQHTPAERFNFANKLRSDMRRPRTVDYLPDQWRKLDMTLTADWPKIKADLDDSVSLERQFVESSGKPFRAMPGIDNKPSEIEFRRYVDVIKKQTKQYE